MRQIQLLIVTRNSSLLNRLSANGLRPFAARFRETLLLFGKVDKTADDAEGRRSTEGASFDSDTKFLALAAASRADYLVTNDRRHLLRLRRYGSTSIVTPAQFLAKVWKP